MLTRKLWLRPNLRSGKPARPCRPRRKRKTRKTARSRRNWPKNARKKLKKNRPKLSARDSDVTWLLIPESIDESQQTFVRSGKKSDL